MALLLLAFGLCAALFGAPAMAGAAPIVDRRDYTPGRHVLVWDGVGDDGHKPRAGVYFFACLVLGANEVTGKIVLLP